MLLPRLDSLPAAALLVLSRSRCALLGRSLEEDNDPFDLRALLLPDEEDLLLPSKIRFAASRPTPPPPSPPPPPPLAAPLLLLPFLDFRAALEEEDFLFAPFRKPPFSPTPAMLL